MDDLKQIKNNNSKYYASEVVGVVFGLTSTSLAAYAVDKISDSNSIISITSAISGTVGATIGSIITYGGLHIKQYKNKHRNFKQDVSSLVKSRLEGKGINYAIRLPLQYILQRFFRVDPVIAAPISQISAGVPEVIVRIVRNYQRNIFGNGKVVGKSIDRARIKRCEVLDDLVD